MLIDVPEGHATYVYPVIIHRSADDVAEAEAISAERRAMLPGD